MPGIKNKHNRALLHAVREGTVAEIIKALQKGASIQAKDNRGHSLLAIAAEHGHLNALRYLVELEGIPLHGHYPLQIAIEKAHKHAQAPEIVTLLLKHLQIQGNWKQLYHALELAVQVASPEVVERVLRHKLTLNKRFAMISEAEKYLSKAFRNIKSPEMTDYIVRHLQSEQQQLAISNSILSATKGLNVDYVNNSGVTLLHLIPPVIIAQEIIQASPEAINKPDIQGRTPLHYATKWLAISNHDPTISRNRYKAILKHTKEVLTYFLTLDNLDINAQDNSGFTALHYAVLRDHEALVRCLFWHKDININIRDRQGNAPIHYAKNSMLKLLLNVGKCDINAQDKLGRTRLHLEIEEDRNVATIDLLISMGADLEIQDHQGRTPLFLAADPAQLLVQHEHFIWDHPENARYQQSIVAMLISAGSNVDASDASLQTLVQYFTPAQALIVPNQHRADAITLICGLLLNAGAHNDIRQNGDILPLFTPNHRLSIQSTIEKKSQSILAEGFLGLCASLEDSSSSLGLLTARPLADSICQSLYPGAPCSHENRYQLLVMASLNKVSRAVHHDLLFKQCSIDKLSQFSMIPTKIWSESIILEKAQRDERNRSRQGREEDETQRIRKTGSSIM